MVSVRVTIQTVFDAVAKSKSVTETFVTLLRSSSSRQVISRFSTMRLSIKILIDAANSSLHL